MDDMMDAMNGSMFKVSRAGAPKAIYEICCGCVGGDPDTVDGLTVELVELANGAALPCDYEITIKKIGSDSVIIPVFKLMQSRRNSATLMDRLEPVLLCFNYNPPSTLDTIAASIKTLLENSGLMYATNINDWGVMDLDSSIFYKNPNGMHLEILENLTEMNRWSMVVKSKCVFLENDDENNRIKCVSVEFLFPSRVLRYRFFEKRSDLLPGSLTGLKYDDLGTISSSDENHILTGCLKSLKSNENRRIPDGHAQWYIEGSDYMRFTGIKSIIDVYKPDKSEYIFFDFADMPYYAIYERDSVGPASADLAFSMIEYLSKFIDSSDHTEKWFYIRWFMSKRREICELPAGESSANVLCLCVPRISDENIQTI
jgi:hypothetical protein